MKALEVLINVEVVGLYVPAEGECFGVMLANVPRTYMRAHVTSGNETENWFWQLPDIKEGETISTKTAQSARSKSMGQGKEGHEKEENKNRSNTSFEADAVRRRSVSCYVSGPRRSTLR